MWIGWWGRFGGWFRPNPSVAWDHWLTAGEQQATLDFHERNPLEGYRQSNGKGPKKTQRDFDLFHARS